MFCCVNLVSLVSVLSFDTTVSSYHPCPLLLSALLMIPKHLQSLISLMIRHFVTLSNLISFRSSCQRLLTTLVVPRCSRRFFLIPLLVFVVFSFLQFIVFASNFDVYNYHIFTEFNDFLCFQVTFTFAASSA